MKSHKKNVAAISARMLKRRVNQVAIDSANVAFSKHAVQRSTSRKITVAMIIRVLRAGEIRGDILQNNSDEYRFTVAARIMEEEIGVVAVMRTSGEGRVYVITVMELVR